MTRDILQAFKIPIASYIGEEPLVLCYALAAGWAVLIVSFILSYGVTARDISTSGEDEERSTMTSG